MDVLQAMTERHSTRAFLNKPVSEKTIVAILEAARFAPSGVNTQPWEVVVITGERIQTLGNRIIAARDASLPENPDYHYYPTTWTEPYKSRRKACGLALYSAIHIKMNETEKRKEAWYRNYHFFGAPVGLLFFIDAALEKGSWVDMGLFLQNIMLAARAFGLETCPQASLAEYPDIVRECVNVSKTKALVCGMALGYADLNHPINQYRTTREAVGSFTRFLGFESQNIQ